VKWHHVVTMASVGIRELRDNLTTVMRRVRRGETVEITHRGQPIAVIAPIGPDRISRLAAAGDITVGEGPFTAPRRRFAVTGPMTATQAIEDDRADR
jgi:prevent-host-death family protein